jgi:hypothetical protein
LDIALSFIVGGIAGWFLNGVLDSAVARLRWAFIRYRAQRHARKVAFRDGLLRVGAEHIFVSEYAPRGFDVARSTLRVSSEPVNVVRDSALGWEAKLRTVGHELAAAAEQVRKEAAAGDGKVLWNGQTLGLRSVRIDRDPMTETQQLTLDFVQSDHAAYVAASQWHRRLIKEDGLPHVEEDKWREIELALSHSFGLNATIETSDCYVILTRRGAIPGSHPGKRHISVNEGIRPTDADRGSLDIEAGLRRGIKEELGIVMAGEAVNFHTLILDIEPYEWALLAHVRVELSLKQIRERRLLAADKWEMESIEAIRFDETEVRRVLEHMDDWIPHGALNLALSLIAERHADASLLDLLRGNA